MQLKWTSGFVFLAYVGAAHGFALRPTQKQAPVMGWTERRKEWLVDRGISK
jgi:hypothetical protein